MIKNNRIYISVGVPALYMIFIVPIGFLVNTTDQVTIFTIIMMSLLREYHKFHIIINIYLVAG